MKLKMQKFDKFITDFIVASAPGFWLCMGIFQLTFRDYKTAVFCFFAYLLFGVALVACYFRKKLD